MSMSLRRKMALRGQAKEARATEKRLAGLSRAGQVSRSSVVVGDGDVMVEDMLVGAVDTALTAEGLESDVGFLDEGVSADLGVTLDAGDSVGDVLIDVADSVPDLGAEFDYTADVDGSAHTARMEAIGANAAVTEAQADAAQAAQDAANALTTASGKNSRRRGVTEPAPPEGGWVQGDQWVREEDRDGVMVPVQVLVWDGTEFVPEQIIADDILVLGSDGVVRIADGSVTASSIAATAIDGKVITGATVRTAASGQRLQMDSGGFKSFKAGGALAGTIKPTPTGFAVDMPNGAEIDIQSSVTGGEVSVTSDTASSWLGVEHGGIPTASLGAVIGSGLLMLQNFGTDARLFSNLPFDIAASTTQSGNTFALKSDLDAWLPIDGTHAWVSSEGREYVRAGGQWKVAFEDTGWVDLTSYLVSTYRGALHGRRKRGTIEILYQGGADVSVPAGNTTLGTLPAEWRPTGPVNRRGAGFMVGGYTGVFFLSSASGAFGISQQTGASRTDPQGHIIFGAD